MHQIRPQLIPVAAEILVTQMKTHMMERSSTYVVQVTKQCEQTTPLFVIPHLQILYINTSDIHRNTSSPNLHTFYITDELPN